MKNLARIARDLYYFYEKNTGVCHFQVEATRGGRFPVDEAAGLLAMHCIVLGRCPRDYVVMLSAQNRALNGLTEKAEKILEAGHSVGGRVRLTRREEEVLAGIMRSFANKEIATSLNVTERTIKFHVSSLLAKFQVSGRMELARKATGYIGGSMPMHLPVPTVPTGETRPCVPVPQSDSNPAQSADVVSLAKQHLMRQGFALSIEDRKFTPTHANVTAKVM